MDVPRGCIFGLVGPSGSGKTTVVRLVLGLIRPQDGDLEVFGRTPADFGPDERVRIGFLPQESALDPDLSLRHNLNFMASLYGLSWRSRWIPGKKSRAARERVAAVLDLLDLTEHQDTRMRDASTGEQRRLAIAAAMVHDPELLVLDEPTAGIDPILREQLWAHFTSLRDEGRTLFVTTQYVTEADKCDLVGLVVDGEILRVDTPRRLRRDAFGGDLVEVAWESRGLDITGVEQLAEVRQIHQWVGPRRVLVAVDDANTGAARIQDWLQEQGEGSPVAVPHNSSFDDVFVSLVTAHRDPDGAPHRLQANATSDTGVSHA
nr:ABC transporter ATP-binding protein [Salsipaludibacter albus]